MADDEKPVSQPVNDADTWTEVEAGLRETWPELEGVGPDEWPDSREETVEMISRMTGASVDDVQRRLDALTGS